MERRSFTRSCRTKGGRWQWGEYDNEASDKLKQYELSII